MLTYSNCTLCPRECGVNRPEGELGFCRMPAGLRIARAAPHYWEEPVIAGAFGAGAVFFSGCTLMCGYCQNAEISRGGAGKDIDAGRLREIFEQLVDDGVQCIELVTPTHFLPDILPALEPKLPVPVVYNCGGYERVETLRELDGKVDVYLPDLKYSDPRLAKNLSAAADYVEVAKAAVLEMFRQVGRPVIRDGCLEKGVILRHLVLPGHVDNSLGVLDWIAENFAPGDILVSLMSQYTPMGGMPAPFDRRVTEEEYAAVLSWAELCSIRDGFVQDITAAEKSFVPDWNYETNV